MYRKLMLFVLLLVVSLATVQAVQIGENVIISLDNVNITVRNNLSFDQVIIGDNVIKFNNSYFWSNWSLVPTYFIDVDLYSWNMTTGNEYYSYDVSSTDAGNPTQVKLQVEDNDTYYVVLVDNSIYDVQQSDANANISISYSNFLFDKAFTIKKEIPTLIAPEDASAQTFDFPPLTNPILFSWSDIGAPSYHLLISETSTFSIITVDTYITGANYTTQLLEAGTYYWKVQAYYPDDTWSGNYTNTWDFELNTTITSNVTTSIHGVVYTSGNAPVSGALVNIWNSTWSNFLVTGSNGYYYFNSLTNSTYSIQATKTGYTDSSTELVTAVTNASTTRNLLLQSASGAGKEYVDHYVKFTVKSLWGTLYNGVTVNVYLGDAVIPQYTGTTGADGSVAFELNENQEYRITFVDAEQEINKEITLYPIDNDYVVYVFTWSYIPDDTPLQTIDYGITYESINLTAGTIYASFTDTESTFTHANFTIKAEDGTVLHSFTTTDTSKNWEQIVTYNNSTIYIAVLEIFDTGLTDGKITQSMVISFKYGIRDSFDFGWEEQWQYQLFGALLMLFAAGLFSMTNAHLGAFVVIGIGWFNIFAGWFPSTITGSLMMILGTFLAIVFIMRKQESK